MITRCWRDLRVTAFVDSPLAGLSPRAFRIAVIQLRRDGTDALWPGRPSSLPLQDRLLLVAAYWRSNLTLCQLYP